MSASIPDGKAATLRHEREEENVPCTVIQRERTKGFVSPSQLLSFTFGSAYSKPGIIILSHKSRIVRTGQSARPSENGIIPHCLCSIEGSYGRPNHRSASHRLFVSALQ
jgi:hypothetical protein